MSVNLPSDFLSAERKCEEALQKQIESWLENSIVTDIVQAVGVSLIVLNSDRQIVAGNLAFQQFLDPIDINTVLGFRPGEAVHCVHCSLHPGGCGTSVACRSCGLAIALADFSSDRQCGECFLTFKKNGTTTSHEFAFTISLVLVGGEQFRLVTLQSIAAEKWRSVMERGLLHTLKNNASASFGVVELLKKSESVLAEDGNGKLLELAAGAASDTLEHIEKYCLLKGVEENTYVSNRSEFELHQFFDAIREKLKRGPHGLPVEWIYPHDVIVSDGKVVKYILEAALENAFEAEPEEPIRVECTVNHEVTFSIHNDKPVSDIMKERMFERS